MANVTVSVPDETKNRMDTFEEINWSAVARQAFEQKVRDLELLREFTRDSELTEEDARELGRRVNERLAERYEVKNKENT